VLKVQGVHMRLKLILFSILFSAMSVVPCLGLTTQEVVSKIQSQYAKISSLTADFAQESTSMMLYQTRIT
jgi:outer membrane lipoprotein-sorting protein